MQAKKLPNYIFLLLLLFLTSCGSSDDTTVIIESDFPAEGSSSSNGSSVGISTSEKDVRIINGVEQSRETSPQFLRIDLVLTDGNLAFCTGTVIGTNSILSAAHCFENVLSASILKPDGSRQDINEVFIHPEYSVNNEVAALFKDAAIAKTATPLNLPKLGILASRELVVGDIVGIYGFGIDENQSSGTLRSGTMQLNTITPNHLFASFDGLSNTCNGDSGGPATYSILDESGNLTAVVVAGITSSGSIADCSEGDLSLFTNVNNPSILSFISQLVPEVSLL